jgi:hypothetical protein
MLSSTYNFAKNIGGYIAHYEHLMLHNAYIRVLPNISKLGNMQLVCLLYMT